jgi:hypothetical protein
MNPSGERREDFDRGDRQRSDGIHSIIRSIAIAKR